MGKLKEYFYEEQNDEKLDDSIESVEREYPIRERIDGYPVRHYYEGENPVWEVYDEDGKLLQVVHSHEELHSFTEGRED